MPIEGQGVAEKCHRVTYA